MLTEKQALLTQKQAELDSISKENLSLKKERSEPNAVIAALRNSHAEALGRQAVSHETAMRYATQRVEFLEAQIGQLQQKAA